MISNHPDPKSFLMYLPPDIQACFNHYSLPLLQAKKYFNSDSLYRPGKLSQGCQRFETSVFFSEKINISTTGGSRVGFFQPDTNHP